MSKFKHMVLIGFAFFSLGLIEDNTLLVPEGVMVEENVKVGTKVVQIIDKRQVEDLYHIVKGNENGEFIISKLGEIIVNKPLSYKVQESYTLEIETDRHKHLYISIDVRELI